MKEIKSRIDNLMFDTIVPIMYVSQQNMDQFENEPIEYIRSQFDFGDTMYQPKMMVHDLLMYVCKWKASKKKGTKPAYLEKFLHYAVENINTYETVKTQQGIENIDWRIKEALMFCIAALSDIIADDKNLKGQMEEML